MFVNTTKTTISAFNISIAFNNEEDFVAIGKIIQLFRLMKVNIIFEPVEIAGKNYLKNIIYGVDEANLTHLKKNNLLIHTSFDYSYFKEDEHVLAEEYLDFALQNYFIKSFVLDKNAKTKFKQDIFQTAFFQQNNKYISNADIYQEYTNSHVLKDCYRILGKSDFYHSFGSKYSIFSINNFNDIVLINVVIEILKYLNLNDKVLFLEQFRTKSINQIIEFLKKHIPNNFTAIDANYIKTLQPISFKDLNIKLPSELTEIGTTLEGRYKVSDIVENIKNKTIKIPEGYELYQILNNKIEYFPNINFWNDFIINPLVKLRKIEINKDIF